MLQSRYVFLDASVLIGLNFNYANPNMKRLVELVDVDRAHLVVSSVMVREVEANIRKEVHSSVQALSKFGKDARILRNLQGPPYVSLFVSLDAGAAEAALVEQFRNFLVATKAQIIALPAASLDLALARYFDRAPPFGEGKKKSEFPDAFTLIALESWCAENSRKVYVVSHDSDLKAYCESSENLLWLERPSEFLELIVLHDEKLAPLVDRLVEAHRDDLESAIAEEFPDLGFWLDDQEGDVYEVVVHGVELQDHALIEVAEEAAVVEVTADVAFTADIEYDDLDTATYDSEDKVLIPWRKIRQQIERSETVTATIRLIIDSRDLDTFEIERTEINTERSWGIGITAAEDDGYPYK